MSDLGDQKTGWCTEEGLDRTRLKTMRNRQGTATLFTEIEADRLVANVSIVVRRKIVDLCVAADDAWTKERENATLKERAANPIQWANEPGFGNPDECEHRCYRWNHTANEGEFVCEHCDQKIAATLQVSYSFVNVTKVEPEKREDLEAVMKAFNEARLGCGDSVSDLIDFLETHG